VGVHNRQKKPTGSATVRLSRKIPLRINTVLYFLAVFLIDTAEGKGKGKTIPLQAWTGPEGSRRLRLPDFNTIGT
jgi:hypothetical protein